MWQNIRGMKITDDYGAKYRLWAAAPRVAPAGPPVRIPGFRWAKFDTWGEFNAWKADAVRRLAEEAARRERSP